VISIAAENGTVLSWLLSVISIAVGNEDIQI
jgi:hypothetical protein